MTRRDQTFDADGNEIAYKEWPDDGTGGIDPGGLINDFDGTIRPLNDDEKAQVAAQVEEDERQADKALIKDDLQGSKDRRDAAVQSRADMHDTTGTARWTRDITVAGTGDTVRLEQRIGHLQAEVRNLHGDVQALSAILVRVRRAQE